MTPESIAALQGDLAEALFGDKEMALLRLAEQMTVDPGRSSAATRTAAEAGWSHEEIADAIFVVAYFNLKTRIVEAFALPPDSCHPFDPAVELPMLRCQDEPRFE